MFNKLRVLSGLAGLVALMFAPALHGGQGELVLHWQTCAGSPVDDQSAAVAVDSNGNVYLTGWSDATWGSPIDPHSGGRDVFVAKLNRNGRNEWNTFMGSSVYDEAKAITVDRSGNVYVVGFSDARWGTPGPPFTFGLGAFVAKLNSNGLRQWVRFMTPQGSQRATAVAVDANGDVYVGGWGGTSEWSTPPNETQVGNGSFVAKLDSSGNEVWHAFFLGTGPGGLQALAVDEGGNVYATGRSEEAWGNPVNPYSGGEDAFVAKLNSNGAVEWNTFMGSSDGDAGHDIAVDGSGNVYVSGSSGTNWGTPINPPGAGEAGAFAAKLDSSGERQWHTFLGGSYGWAIAAGEGQNVYITGVWLASDPPFGGFVAELNSDGVLQANTLLEPTLDQMALDGSGNVYVSGEIGLLSGPLVNPQAGGWDAFVAKLSKPSLTTVSAASFIPDEPLAPRSIAAGFGQGLAPVMESAAVVPLPTILAETSVRVQDNQNSERLAPLFFVSPDQINFLVPEGTAVGEATVRVISGDVMVSVGTLTVAYVSPGVFSMNVDGEGVPAALAIFVKPDGSQTWQYVFNTDCQAGSCQPVPLDLGETSDQVFLQLYGTGIRGRSSLSQVTATIGGVDAPVEYAGPVSDMVGLDQVNLRVPRSLIGRGEVDVVLTVDGKTTNPVQINIR